MHWCKAIIVAYSLITIVNFLSIITKIMFGGYSLVKPNNRLDNYF